MHQGWSFGQRSDDAETTLHAHTSFPHLDISAGGICESSVADDSGDSSRLDQYLGAGHPRICRGVASQAEGVRTKEGRRESRNGPQLLGEGGSLEDRNEFGRTTREKASARSGRTRVISSATWRRFRKSAADPQQAPSFLPGIHCMCPAPGQAGGCVRFRRDGRYVGCKYPAPWACISTPPTVPGLHPSPAPTHSRKGDPTPGHPRYRQDRRDAVALGH